jgi:hypothetical protein
MKTGHITDEQLFDFIDGNTSEKDQKRINELLEQDTEFKKRFDAISNFELQLKNKMLQTPSPNFTEIVMGKISLLKNPYKKGDWMIWIVTLLSVICVSFFLSDIDIKLDLDIQSNLLDGINIYEQPINLNINEEIDLTLLNKGLLYTLLILALLLFDKTVLRPFFRNRHMINH